MRISDWSSDVFSSDLLTLSRLARSNYRGPVAFDTSPEDQFEDREDAGRVMGIADETEAAGDVQRLIAARSSREYSALPLGYRVFGSRTARSASLGIDDLVYGVLTSAMMVDDSDVADLTAFSDPPLSGRLAFLMGRNLETPPDSIDDDIEEVEPLGRASCRERVCQYV